MTKKIVPFHELGKKINLVSLKDGRDKAACIRCGKVFHYGIPKPRTVAGTCKVDEAVYREYRKRRVVVPLGWWTVKRHFTGECGTCGGTTLRVPRRSHPLSQFWKLKQHRDEILIYCSGKCTQEIDRVQHPRERF